MKTLLYKACLFIMFVVCCIDVAAQSDSLKIDSLKKVLLTEKEDTNKVNTLNELSQTLIQYADAGNSMQYAQQALLLSKKINFKIGIGKAYINAGGAFYEKDNYIEALKKFYRALGYFEDVSDKRGMSQARQFIGGIYTYQNNDSEALKNFSIALKLNEEMGNKSRIAQNLTSIAGIYSNEGKYPEAAEKFTLALDIYKALGDKAPIWAFPFVYGSMGILNKNEGIGALASGSKMFAEKNFSDALKNYQSALKLYQQMGDLSSVAGMYIGLGEVYFYLDQNFKAKNFVQKGLQLTINLKGSKDYMRAAYEMLAKIDNANKNYKEAYEHYKLYILYRDSIVNEENTKKSLQTSMQYEFDKKESIAKTAQDKKDADAKRIKNQQYFAIAALGVVVLAVLIIALIQFRNNKQKQKANLLLETQKQKVETTLTELKSTQAQLIQSEKMASLGELTAGIAHEIQNPLNFVNNFSEVNKELIEELRIKNEKLKIEDDEVNDLLSDLADNEEKINHHGKRADSIVKGMLQHSRQTKGMKESTDINALCDEYLRLSYHGLRAKDKNFNADFKTDFDESIGNINIVAQDVGRVLLNLFNNAFYAVNEKKKLSANSYQPIAKVTTRRLNDKVEIRVEDNGSGIPQNIIDKIFQPFFTTKPTGQGTGLGLSLAYDIITKEHNGTIKAESKEGEGTTFIIDLPINKA